jgi:flagellar motility protein MotE (MotC chaperone)
MEFATEIGQNLLVEVRRLQALLNERDRALEKFGEEKDAWEAERDGLVTAIRSAESSVGTWR